MQAGQKFQCCENLEIIIGFKPLLEGTIRAGEIVELSKWKKEDGIFVPILFRGKRIAIHPNRFENHFITA